eukprot:3291433-Pyramimonas_sp.AAC.1
MDAREVEGNTYYTFEYTAQGRGYSRHSVASVSIRDGETNQTQDAREVIRYLPLHHDRLGKCLGFWEGTARPQAQDSNPAGVDCRSANGSLPAGNIRRIFYGIFEMPCAE